MLLKLYAVQRLGEDIRDHLFGWAVNKLNLTCCSNVTDIMILYVNVLVALVDCLILDRVDRALVIRTMRFKTQESLYAKGMITPVRRRR